MISQEILEKIVFFSNEEIDNLNGKNQIDKSIFTTESSSTIDYHKLIEPNEQMAIRKHVRFCEYPTHSHNYIELIYVYSGSITHVINGQELIQKKGEFLLLNQYVEHATKFAGEDDIAFNFIIKPNYLDYLGQLFDEENQLSQFLFSTLYSYENKGSFIHFRVSEYGRINHLAEEIITLLYSNSINKSILLKLAVGSLLASLMEYPEETFASSFDSMEATLMNQVYRYIKTNYKEGSLQQLSTLTKQSDYQLCKLIKKKTNKTFIELIQEERLEQSATLLATTYLPISTIMEKVGYDNATYFYRIFKKKKGITPKEFRRINAK